MSSNRTFGFVFVIVFGVIALIPLIGGGPPRLWALAATALVLATTLFKPDWLTPFNRAWLHVGKFLHRVTSLLVIAVIYFAVVTPTGVVMRAFGKDPLRLQRDPEASSYWIPRDPPGPDPETMTNQF